MMAVEESPLRKIVCVVQADARGRAETPIALGVEACLLAIETQPLGCSPPKTFDVRLLTNHLKVFGGHKIRLFDRFVDVLCRLGLERPDRKQAQIIEFDGHHPVIEQFERLRLRVEGLSPGGKARITFYFGEVEDQVMKQLGKR